MSLRTIHDIFYAAIDRNLDRAFLVKRQGNWLSVSASDLYRHTLGVAQAFSSWQIKPGDRIAILSENRHEWAVADFASLLSGAVLVPIYPTQTAEQAAWILNDSQTRVIFVSTAAQLEKILSIKSQTSLERVVVMDSVGGDSVIPMESLVNPTTLGRDPHFDGRRNSANPDDLATIIYTSGTTGVPKGVMLTHGNLTSNIDAAAQLFDKVMSPGESYISFLPLSHVTARHVDYLMVYRGVSVAYCPFVEELPAAFSEIRPTIVVSVPRVLEKIRDKVQRETQTGLKHTIYNWAMGVGRTNRSQILAGKRPLSLSWKLANKIFYSKILQALGGRAKYFISGGAPLGRTLAEWYADIGIRIHEGYGLTETSPVISVNTPDAHRMGTVGKTLPNLYVRIADDGEILVRGPSVFKGYWKSPQQTAEAFVDGWFKTGDIGNIDADGFLNITDRKKDLIKTSGGKFIAPQPIETAIKSHHLVGDAAIVGDRRKFASALISPNFAILEEWARSKNITFSSREELVKNPLVLELYDSLISELNKNLAQFEKMKKFVLLPDEFSIQNGLLTPTMKLRRKVLEERYRDQIEDLYQAAETAER